ncbi:MAG: hypothetical protein ACTMUB_05015 [cyanobacterium endosymbiont of Rhopalodia musculus]|nr:hypothetical protein [cyanobacterium endosymbiont of Epithemia clementina EcSB]WGT67516.1 hypothetical protein P3F56_10100 [cyanobacterium endosymbiont of Epithemia clementina EcSB]
MQTSISAMADRGSLRHSLTSPTNVEDDVKIITPRCTILARLTKI